MTTSPIAQRTLDFGVTMKRVDVESGEPYWKLVSADGPLDFGGNHHLYVDVWDEQGNRMVGETVVFYSQDEEWPTKTEAKPGEPQAANLPMYAGGNAYGVRVAELPSDAISGFGLGKNVPHHSFRVVFQRAIADGQTQPPTEPAPDLNELRVAFLQIQAIAAAALKRMETM